MTFLVHHSLWLLLRLRCKGWLRAQFSGKSIPRLISAVIGAVLFAGWIINYFVWSALSGRRGATHISTPEDVINFASLAMGAITAITLIFGGGTKLMTFRPAELDLVVPGPYAPRTLINYKLLTIFASGIFSGVFYALIFARHTGHFVGAFFAGVLATLFSTLAGIALGLLGEIAGYRKIIVLSVARGVVVLAVAWVVYQFILAARAAQEAAKSASAAAGTDAALRLQAVQEAIGLRARVGGVMSDPLVNIVTAPFKPFAHLFAATSPLPALGWGCLCAVMTFALWVAIVRMHRAWQEVAVRVSDESARAAEKLVTGGRSRGSFSKRFAALAPQLLWMGPTRAVTRRHLMASMPLVIAMPLLGVLTPLVMYLVVALSDDSRNLQEVAGNVGAIAGFGLLPAAVFVAPAMLRMDFRADLDHIETLKTLPFSPIRLVSAQLFTPLVVASLMALGLACSALFMGRASLLKSIDGPLVALILAAIPLLILIVLCIDNALFLLLPERPMQTKGVNVAMTGRRVLTTAARILTFGLVLAPAGLLGWLAYFVTSSPTAAAMTALVLIAVAAIAGVAIVAKTFERFDVSRDMPE